MPERTIETLSELEALGEEILTELAPTTHAQVLALSGDLGAGKTTFIQAIAKKLGVKEQVTSPTFMIMRSYQTTDDVFKKLIHIDAYRVEDVSEIKVLNIPELFEEPGTLVCVEWPERIATVIPNSAYAITFELNENGSRHIVYGS